MDATDRQNIGIVLLAAGSSRRLGSPKQLLEFQNKTLIRRAAETALLIEVPTVVVLGANFDTIKTEIENLPLTIVFNEDWESGMSSSVKIGLTKLLEIAPRISAVVLLLCDQPFVSEDLIFRLIAARYESKKLIAASEYSDVVGVPAIFAREIFDELMNLRGDKGARFVIEKFAASTVKIPAPEAAFDVDLPEDVFKLRTEKFAL